MSRHKLWCGISPLSVAEDSECVPDRLVKVCSAGEELFALAGDLSILRCRLCEEKDVISFSRISGLRALDLAYDGNSLYVIEAHGRLFKSLGNDIDHLKEVFVCEEARSCIHGFKTPSRKVKFRNVEASEFGCLLTSDDGQLWGSGSMPEVALNTTDFQKITFFEGRTVFCSSIGSNFAAVISRKNVKTSKNYDTDSDDEGVFASECSQCQSITGSLSPSFLASPDEICPLGVQLCHSSRENVTVGVAATNDKFTLYDKNIEPTATNYERPSNQNATSENSLHADCSNIVSNSLNSLEKVDNILTTTDAARQFLTKQLSWISAGEDYISEYTEMPTRIIKENVTNLTNLVVEGVKTVGDKVATLSRHVSGGSETADPVLLDLTESLLYKFSSSCKFDDYQASTSSVASDKNAENLINERLLLLAKQGHNILSTELWTWGGIEHGQLGTGDTIRRATPMMVTSLSGYGLQKVSCGKYHCSALTLDGRMFSWGNNHFHQVDCNSRSFRSSPVPFSKNDQTERVRDIASAADHSVVYTYNNNIFYAGRYDGEYTPQIMNIVAESQSDTISNNDVRENIETNNSIERCCKRRCPHWRLSTCNQITYSCIEDSSKSHLSVLSTAQIILEEMLLIYNSIIKPFHQKSKLVNSHNDVYESACDLYTQILQVTALNVLSLWRHSENSVDKTEISIFKNCELHIHLYKKYLKSICDLICISGFNQVAKILVGIPSSITNLFGDQIPLNKQIGNNMTEAIIVLCFVRPLSRINSHTSILKLVDNNARDILAQWSAMSEDQERKIKEAEVTLLFWETAGKVLNQYRTPDRRLIRESRSRLLNLVHAGRFSSHWFVLLSDVLLHVSGSTQVLHPLKTLWVEPVTDTDAIQNALRLITPEETLVVSTPNSHDKTEWLHALHCSINAALGKSSTIPPSIRTAAYTFTNKNQLFKDAKYQGRWMDGKVHGRGKLEWPDGKMYIGDFHKNNMHGRGKMDIPDVGVYEGEWRENLQHGHGTMRYASGDLHEGEWRAGLPHGHGVRRQGGFMSASAAVYIGEWSRGQRSGYGVEDDIGKGEKYLGSWCDNRRHGCGLIVTLDAIYYEGVFMQDALTGHGVMVFEDNTHYEGEFRSAGVFGGRGTLTLTSGDRFEGTLQGAWTEGVKISNGVLHMNVTANAEQPTPSKPASFGKLCVAPDQKWTALFRQCAECLGIADTRPSSPTAATNDKIWRNVAAVIANSHRTPSKGGKDLEDSLDCLQVIPQFGQEKLDAASYADVKKYVEKACSSRHHPLGRLVADATDAFNATYGGVRVHPLLLSHAILELRSVMRRLYELVRELFPALPPPGADSALQREEGAENVVSAASLLQPVLLPRVHPALFVLYALHNKHEDSLYWRRLLEWNRQTDAALMARLGVDRKFWAEREEEKAGAREHLLSEAVETLQQLKTTFCPLEKLLVVRATFKRLTEAAHRLLGSDYLWSMDDLFPVFVFVVVRARVLQLGSELHLVEDLLEPGLQHGELGIMFTTLKACYFQILQEKVSLAQ